MSGGNKKLTPYQNSPGYGREKAPMQNPYFKPEAQEEEYYEPPRSSRRGERKKPARNYIKNENVVSAILALIKELNSVELDFLRREIEKKISKGKSLLV